MHIFLHACPHSLCIKMRKIMPIYHYVFPYSLVFTDVLQFPMDDFCKKCMHAFYAYIKISSAPRRLTKPCTKLSFTYIAKRFSVIEPKQAGRWLTSIEEAFRRCCRRIHSGRKQIIKKWKWIFFRQPAQQNNIIPNPDIK